MLIYSALGELTERHARKGWWPAETPFEICAGAILTQNTNWKNAATAVAKLKEAGLLSPACIIETEQGKLEELIRSAGFYRQKAERLKALSLFIQDELSGDITHLRDYPLDEAREKLLAIKGIGNETADTILLYACHIPSFVVDSYTIRWLNRMGVGKERYGDVKGLFEQILPRDAEKYAIAHAAIVEFSKNICSSTPRCEICTLKDRCHHYLRERKQRSRRPAQARGQQSGEQ